jgi:hypothetical protein
LCLLLTLYRLASTFLTEHTNANQANTMPCK